MHDDPNCVRYFNHRERTMEDNKMKINELNVRASIATVAALVSSGLLQTSAMASDIDVNSALQSALTAKYSDPQLYEKAFGGVYPNGTLFDRVHFRGHLLGTGIHHDVPGDGIPAVPELGDEGHITNCTSPPLPRSVVLTTTEGESSNWSVSNGFSTTVGQDYTIGASFKAGSDVFGGEVTGKAEMKTSWQINSSEDFNKGKQESVEHTYTTTVTATAAPNKQYDVQLMISKSVANNIPFTATFRASGNTDVYFKSPINKVCIKSDQGKYLTAEDDEKTVTWGKRGRTQCESWEQFVIEDANGGELLSGDPVYVLTNLHRYWSAQDTDALDADRTSKGPWERFTLGKVSGSPGTQIVSGDKVSFLSSHGKPTRPTRCAQTGIAPAPGKPSR
jgi:hypothetical protein